MRHYARQLAGYERPEPFHCVETGSLRNANGNALKRELRRRLL